MTWHLLPPTADDPIVRLTMTGRADTPSLGAAFGACLAECVEHDVWRVITDLREMSAEHTVVDLFGLIATMTDLGVADRFREALIVGTDAGTRELAGFFETVAVNRGLAVRVLTDVAEAEAWLTA
jgi:hypothetical protein